jgi:gluconolactonase
VVRQIVPTGNTFNDGPQWVDADGGFLVYSQVFSQQVLKIGPDGGDLGVLRATGNPNLYPIGNAVKPPYVLTTVSTDVPGGGLQAGIYQTLIADGGAGPLLTTGVSDNPNDLVILPNGTILFTDPQYQIGNGPTEGLYRKAPDGGVAAVQTANIFRPNGIALSPDNKTLYVGQAPAQLDPGAAVNRKILKFAVAADGTVTAPGQTFIDAPLLADVPDGIAVDIGGNLWIAEAAADGSESGRVEVFSPAGAKLGTIPFPNGRPTGVAFGGADGKGLYITTEKAVFVYVSRCAGIK